MTKLYLKGFVCLLTVLTLFSKSSFSQSCTLTAVCVSTESRCAATGTVQVNASGGSGNYLYKVSGPVVTNYTSSSLIGGLSTGSYLVTVQDLTTNCIYQDSVIVTGDYSAPSFTMVAGDVTCINGNDGTITNTGQLLGRGPFVYTIIAPSASSVGATNSTGNFSGLLSGNYLVQLTDSCGAIQTRGITVQNYDWIIDPYSVTKVGCDIISVVINLKDNKNRATPDSVFNSFTYGASVIPGDTTWFTSNNFYYYIGTHHTVSLFVKDGCGNIKKVTWTDPDVPNVNAGVSISDKSCLYFTATVTGQVHLTNPQYCIYDVNDALVSCNSTGRFDSLPYGQYCIKITNNCYDTIITRCFTVNRNIPSAGPWVQINSTCTDMTVSVIGQSNLTNPNFCLYDSADVLITCNSTGSFTNLPFGTYCIKIINDPACYDTTISRCFTYNRPVPSAAANVAITNMACSTFTATITGITNWNNPQFCIYTSANVLIVCNTTGVFDNLPYGTYCIDISNGAGCYDTTISRCFTVNRLVPSVNPGVIVSNRWCTTFSAAITGKSNLSDPQYCLYDSSDVLISCNTTGTFDSLIYGNYCIKIRNDSTCYDTTIVRCFTEYDTAALAITLTAKKSCVALGTTDIDVSITNGSAAYTIELFSPSGSLLQTISNNSSGSYTFTGLPDLAASLAYKIIVTDQCGRKDSSLVIPVVSFVKAGFTVTRKCPSSTWANGSADVEVDITNNNVGGTIDPVIIKKDGVNVTINANTGLGYIYTFLNLGPGTYIFDTYINNCSLHVFDTVVIGAYVPPNLSRSAAYQCDNNSFSIGAVVAGGIAPYMFEIIGSIPASPSIIAGPQPSPLFTINNGTIYSLIRLRATDACANAGLNDVSVLPLANTIITATDTCFYQNITLSVDTVINAVYTWYKRIPVDDSVIVGTGPSYNIPFLLPTDTGRYVCKMTVNNGCLTQLANFTLTGDCGTVLPVGLLLSGTRLQDAVHLKWTNDNAANTPEYQLERSANNSSNWTMISKIPGSSTAYSYTDRSPLKGNNYYRLKYITNNNIAKYSNTVMIRNGVLNISYYPNPVRNSLHISIQGNAARNYRVDISDVMGKKLLSATYYNIQERLLEFPRSPGMNNGIYLLTITELGSNEKQTFKLVYE